MPCAYCNFPFPMGSSWSACAWPRDGCSSTLVRRDGVGRGGAGRTPPGDTRFSAWLIGDYGRSWKACVRIALVHRRIRWREASLADARREETKEGVERFEGLASRRVYPGCFTLERCGDGRRGRRAVPSRTGSGRAAPRHAGGERYTGTGYGGGGGGGGGGRSAAPDRYTRSTVGAVPSTLAHKQIYAYTRKRIPRLKWEVYA